MMHGATDIFIKPVTGAANEGFEGFFKGLGRGTVSILVKPTLGVVDLAMYTMEGIRRYACMTAYVSIPMYICVNYQ